MASSSAPERPVEYEKCFFVSHAPTLSNLRIMSTDLKSLRSGVVEKGVETALAIRYAKNLCLLSYALVFEYPEAMQKQRMWWVHGELKCNCIWFEVIRRGLDAARMCLAQSLRIHENEPTQKLRDEFDKTMDVIGILSYLKEVTFPAWKDCPPAVVTQGYDRATLDSLLGLTRAFGFWLLACMTMQTDGLAHVTHDFRKDGSAKTIETLDSLKLIAALYRQCYNELSGLPAKYSLKCADDGRLDRGTLYNMGASGFSTTLNEDSKMSQRTQQPISHPAPWSQNILYISLRSMANHYWVVKPGLAISCLRLAKHNGCPVDMYDMEAKEEANSRKYKDIPPPVEQFKKTIAVDFVLPSNITDSVTRGRLPIDTKQAAPSSGFILDR